MTETYDDRYSKSENATRYIKQRVADLAPTLDSDNDSSEEKRKTKLKPALLTSVVAGGIAGVIVDISLYPLDTIKTRLQSRAGFRSSGGFRGIYKGIIPVLLGSAPISALFFATYNTIINTLRTEDSHLNPFVYLAAASAAEVLCASVRVPLEIVKQRKQTSNTSSLYIIRKTLRKEGFWGFYRGFWSTLWREIPFAAIQYPVWEYMINQLIIYQHGKELTALQTAYCGAAAGAIAAALTTPMDVIKTRIMLAEREKIERYKPTMNFNFAKEIFHDRGIRGFFAGAVPRVLWITLGGFIYFGAYEKAKLLSEEKWCAIKNSIKKVHEVSPSYLEEKLETFTSWTERFCPSEETQDDITKNHITENNITENDIKIVDPEDGLLAQKQKIIDATLLLPNETPQPVEANEGPTTPEAKNQEE